MSEKSKGEEEQEVAIDLFQPADAPVVVALFRRVYGEHYPVKYYYDPDQLREAVAKRDTLLIVARLPQAGIVGVVSIFRSSPNPQLYEIGSGLVHPGYRSLGINNRLLTFAMENEDLHSRFLIASIWGEAVCNHIFMQKTSKHQRVVEMAIEVDLMPAEAYVKEQSASGRVASIAVFRTYRPLPHTIFLPPCYEDLIRSLYQEFDDSRMLQAASETPPIEGSRTVLDEQVFDSASVARIPIRSFGGDFIGVLSALETRLQGQGIHLVQVWLRLTEPSVGWATEQLRQRGYFFCGVFPRWFEEGDGLLMEKTLARPHWEGIQLYSERAKGLLQYIRAEWERTKRMG